MKKIVGLASIFALLFSLSACTTSHVQVKKVKAGWVMVLCTEEVDQPAEGCGKDAKEVPSESTPIVR